MQLLFIGKVLVKSCTFGITTFVFKEKNDRKGSARMKRRSFLKLTAIAGIAAADPLGNYFFI